MMKNSKRCQMCKKIKPIEEFQKKTSDILYSYCIKCRRKRWRDYQNGRNTYKKIQIIGDRKPKKKQKNKLDSVFINEFLTSDEKESPEERLKDYCHGANVSVDGILVVVNGEILDTDFAKEWAKKKKRKLAKCKQT